MSEPLPETWELANQKNWMQNEIMNFDLLHCSKVEDLLVYLYSQAQNASFAKHWSTINLE